MTRKRFNLEVRADLTALAWELRVNESMSYRAIATELTRAGHPVSAMTVRKWLHQHADDVYAELTRNAGTVIAELVENQRRVRAAAWEGWDRSRHPLRAVTHRQRGAGPEMDEITVEERHDYRGDVRFLEQVGKADDRIADLLGLRHTAGSVEMTAPPTIIVRWNGAPDDSQTIS